MRRQVVLICTVTVFTLSFASSVDAATVPVTATPDNPIQAVFADLVNGTSALIASIEAAVGSFALAITGHTSGAPIAATASVAAAVGSNPVVAQAPTEQPVPTPPPPKASAVATQPDTVAPPVTSSANIFALQSAVAQLTQGMRGLTDLFASPTPSSKIENQIANLQYALASQNSRNYAAAAVMVPQQVAAGGAPNTIAAASNIGQLSGVTITNANLSASEIPALDYLSLSGGTLSGTLGVPTLNASSTMLGSVTSTNATTTILAVTGTSTLAGIDLSAINCSTYGNGGKLTTDAFGDVICAADQGGSGSTVAGAETQIQFNGGGSFSGSSSFTFATSTGRLTVPEASTTNLSVSNDATLGNATSTSLFSSIADFTNGVISTLNASIAKITGFTATNATTTNATSTNLYAASAVIPTLVSTNATLTNATTTSLSINGQTFTNLLGTGLTDASGALTVSLSPFTTANLTEGSNLYFTPARVASVIAGTTTDALAQGATNKYFSNALAQGAISVSGLPLTYSSGVVGINQAGGSQPGFLASSDWTNFNGKLASSSLSAGSGIGYSGTTGVISNTGVTALAASYPLLTTGSAGSLTLSLGFGTTTANAWSSLQTLSNGFIANSSSTVIGNFTSTGNGIFGGNVGIGTASPLRTLDVSGTFNATTSNDSSIFAFIPPATGGSWLANNQFSSSYSSTHNDTRATLNVSRSATGSGTNGPATADDGAFITSEKTNYLTSSVGGEVDGLYVLTAQGNQGDTGGINIGANKVYGGSSPTGGALGIEASTRWLDASSNILMDVHSLVGFAEGAGGQSNNTGYGFYTEDQDAAHATSSNQITPWAAYYGGAFDNNGNCPSACPAFANLLVGAGSRSASDIYFKITGGLNQAGNIVVGSGDPTGANGIATQSGGTRWTMENVSGDWRLYANDGATVLQTIKQSGNIGIGTTTPKNLLDINSGTSPTNDQLAIEANGVPGFSILDASADNINLNFDQIYKSGFVAQNATVAQITKGSGLLLFRGSGGNTVDSIATNNNYMALNLTSGNLDIGTTTPTGKLEVDGGQLVVDDKGSPSGMVFNSNSVAKGLLAVAEGPGEFAANTAAGDLVLRTSGGKMFFDTNSGSGNSALTILGSNGNVGVGTTSPLKTLSINGTIGATVAAFGNAALATSSTIGPHSILNSTGYVSGYINSPLVSIGNGGSAAVFGAKTSDNSGPSSNVTIPLNCFVAADNTTTAHNSWCEYIEGDLNANSVPSEHLNEENSVASYWSTVNSDPYTTNPIGATYNLRLDSGIGASGPNNMSAALDIVNNGAAYESGIVISSNALDTSAGRIAPALALATNQAVDWYAAAGSPAWSIYSTATGGSNSLILTNTAATFSSRLGVGTTTPQQKLVVSGGGSNLLSDFLSDGSSAFSGLRLGRTSPDVNIAIVGSGGQFAPGSAPGDLTVESLGHNILFSTDTGATTQLYLKNGGNVGIGTATPYSPLQITGPDTASTSAFAVVNSASTTEFTVYDTGNAVLAGSLTQNSDQRLKTNISDLNGSSSLAEINALNPITFNWIDPQKSSVPQFGFIAQQVEQVFPNLVSTTSPTALTPDGTLSLNYIDLISPIVAAIQELDSELTSLANTVANFAESFTTNQLTFVRGQGSEIDVQKLCIGSTCITEAQLQAMVAAANQTANAPASPSPSTSEATDTPPVIQINGANPAVIQVGATYNDLGATITGPQADLNLGITTYLNGLAASPIVIDTSTAATDTIDYLVTDQKGLTSTSTRTVIIEASDQPTIATTTVATSSSADTAVLTATSSATTTSQ